MRQMGCLHVRHKRGHYSGSRNKRERKKGAACCQFVQCTPITFNLYRLDSQHRHPGTRKTHKMKAIKLSRRYSRANERERRRGEVCRKRAAVGVRGGTSRLSHIETLFPISVYKKTTDSARQTTCGRNTSEGWPFLPYLNAASSGACLLSSLQE